MFQISPHLCEGYWLFKKKEQALQNVLPWLSVSISIGHKSTQKNTCQTTSWKQYSFSCLSVICSSGLYKSSESDCTWERGRESLWLCTFFSSEDQEWSCRLKNKEIFSLSTPYKDHGTFLNLCWISKFWSKLQLTWNGLQLHDLYLNYSEGK